MDWSLARAKIDWPTKTLYTRTEAVSFIHMTLGIENELQWNFSKNFSLRDGITANPSNWQKCTMFVQDLVEAGVNITADVSKEEAYNFQEMCQMFSTGRKSSPVKRVPRPTSSPTKNVQSIRKAFSHNSLNDIKSNTVKKASTAAVATTESPSNMMKKVASAKKGVAKVSVILENAIKDKSLFNMITMELDKITHSDGRVRHEAQILGILKQHFKIFDRAVVLIPFGSTVFGFASENSNYNIFVDTRKLNVIYCGYFRTEYNGLLIN